MTRIDRGFSHTSVDHHPDRVEARNHREKLFIVKDDPREETETVLYRSKMNPVTKRNFAVFPVLDWIAALTVHIPNKGEQLVRYYGYYSNVSRGKRKKEKPKEETEISWKPEVIEIEAPPVSKELKKRWSYFIRKVYETDPLTCPKCQGEMRIIAFIDWPDVIKELLII